MKISRLYPSLLAAVCAPVLLVTIACAEDSNSSTIKFSDPGKPGTVKINLGRGDLTVQGADTAEVTVKSDAKAVTNQPRKNRAKTVFASSPRRRVSRSARKQTS
jgi:hypothetical protein